MTQDQELERYRQVAVEAAKKASERARKLFGNAKDIGKDYGSFSGDALTQADLECEEIIITHLKEALPEHGIVSEEAGTLDEEEYTWYVDPIDGTANYARKNPWYGINIGLAHNGEPVVGVIAYPEQQEILSATPQGAYLGEEPISVSGRSMEEALYCSGGVWKTILDVHPQVAAKVGDVRVIGAGSVMLGEIARGRAEILIFYTASPHDVVAGAAIIKGAGGRITTLTGEPYRVGKSFLATNGIVHEEVLAILKKHPKA